MEISFSELKELMTPERPDNTIASRYIGKEVIVRSYSGGNHFGVLKSYEPNAGVVVLENSRRLWRWEVERGVSLSEVAIYGITGDSKICTVVPEQIVAEIDEILPASKVSAESIRSAPVFRGGGQ